MIARILHTTNAELHTEQFWAEHIDPIARACGLEPPTQLDRDPGDLTAHLLKDSEGRVVLIVRTEAVERVGRQ